MRRFGIAALLTVIAVAVGAPAWATVVTHLPGANWEVAATTTSGGHAAIADGPDTPPAGTGSLRLSVDALADRVIVSTDLGSLTARPWSGLSARYSTFVQPGGGPEFAPTLRFAGFQSGQTAFTTLSFEPRLNGTVTTGGWQSWALGADSTVWQTNATDAGFCVQAAPCTFAAFVARYPNGVWGQAQLGLGTGVPGPAAGFADAVTLRDRTTEQFTDFDPVAASAAPTGTPAAPGSPLRSGTPGPVLAVTGSQDVLEMGLLGVGIILIGGGLLVLATLIRRRSARD
jgi:hypothetical protein